MGGFWCSAFCDSDFTQKEPKNSRNLCQPVRENMLIPNKVLGGCIKSNVVDNTWETSISISLKAGVHRLNMAEDCLETRSYIKSWISWIWTKLSYGDERIAFGGPGVLLFGTATYWDNVLHYKWLKYWKVGPAGQALLSSGCEESRKGCYYAQWGKFQISPHSQELCRFLREWWKLPHIKEIQQ